MMTSFYYDSYAIIEYLKANPKYQKYFIMPGLTGYENLIEVFYSMLKEEGLDKARIVLEKFATILIYPTVEDIEPAMVFKLQHRSKNFSYVDCLGYTLAKKHHLIFLTGDKGFEHMPNVEFMRK